LSDYFMTYSESKDSYDKDIDFRVSLDNEKVVRKYVTLFLNKIEDYLTRHNNEVYFNRWESKFIRTTDTNFNPEKEIIFSSAKELFNNKKITLENLSL